MAEFYAESIMVFITLELLKGQEISFYLTRLNLHLVVEEISSAVRPY